jgi:hypothetical protein
VDQLRVDQFLAINRQDRCKWGWIIRVWVFPHGQSVELIGYQMYAQLLAEPHVALQDIFRVAAAWYQMS